MSLYLPDTNTCFQLLNGGSTALTVFANGFTPDFLYKFSISGGRRAASRRIPLLDAVHYAVI